MGQLLVSLDVICDIWAPVFDSEIEQAANAKCPDELLKTHVRNSIGAAHMVEEELGLVVAAGVDRHHIMLPAGFGNKGFGGDQRSAMKVGLLLAEKIVHYGLDNEISLSSDSDDMFRKSLAAQKKESHGWSMLGNDVAEILGNSKKWVISQCCR